MKYTIQTIQEILDESGWKIESDTYQNLDEPLTFECPEGHKVYDTWRHIRTNQRCPICEQNKYKNQSHSPHKKNKDTIRTLALDQSSRITGYSIYDNDTLVDYGVFEATQSDEIARANQLKQWVISMCSLWNIDWVGIEGVQLQQNMGVTTFQTLCRVQGILMNTCYDLKIHYQICPTNTWRAHCGVTGRYRADKKRSCQLLIKKWYDVSVTEDEADAIGIGKYMAEKITKQTKVTIWE